MAYLIHFALEFVHSLYEFSKIYLFTKTQKQEHIKDTLELQYCGHWAFWETMGNWGTIIDEKHFEESHMTNIKESAKLSNRSKTTSEL